MKILVCGSRNWPNPETIFETLRDLTPKYEIDIIHGDAPGADRIAAEAAKTLGFKSVTAFPAEWRVYGKSAGYRRNLEMLAEKPDLVLAFWDGMSKGCKHTIDQAIARNIPVDIVELPDWRGK